MLCLGVAFAFSACARVAGQGDFLIHGSLVDAETGAPVKHRGIYVHVFNDASDHQTSVGPQPQGGFKVRMPSPAIRLRVVDTTDVYELHEEQLVVPKEGLALVVRLVPTHFVLLRARLVVDQGGVWVPLPPRELPPQLDESRIISGSPTLCLSRADRAPGDPWIGGIDLEARCERYVPRERLALGTLDTEFWPDPPILDLTGVTGDVVEREIRLVKTR